MPCRVWELDLVFFLFYFQSLALGTEPLKIQRPILIVLFKIKLIYICIPIAIEKHLIASCLQQATYRFIWSSGL